MSLYPYEVNAVKNGVCETILVIAESYDAALKELETEGYAAPEPKDINAMSHKNIIIQKGVEK